MVHFDLAGVAAGSSSHRFVLALVASLVIIAKTNTCPVVPVAVASETVDPPSHNWFGHSIAILDEADKDGCSEIAVGSPIADGSGLGTVTIYSGRTFEARTQLHGDAHVDGFGTFVESVPDVDGDGRRDLLVGSPWPSEIGRGGVSLISSKSGKVIQRQTAAKDEICFGKNGCVSHGKDGKADRLLLRLVAARRVEGRNVDFFRYVLLTLPDLERRWMSELPSDSWFEEGTSMCGIPDVNGDGVPDFAIRMKGSVSILSGKSGDVLLCISPEHASVRFGFSLCPVDDLDGDGIEDLAVGDPGDPYSNESDGCVRVYSTKTAKPLWSSSGGQSSDVGFAMDVTTDVDHDGVRDVAVSRLVAFADGVTFLSGKNGNVLRVVNRFELQEDDFLPSLGYRVRAGGTFGPDHAQGLLVTRYSPRCPGSNGQSVWVIDVEGHLLGEIKPPVMDAAAARPTPK